MSKLGEAGLLHPIKIFGDRILMTDAGRNQRILASLGLVALSFVIVGTVIVTPSLSKVTMMNTASTTISKPTSSPITSNASSSGIYQDGDYSAIGKYYSPGGQESIKVSLSLKDGTITTAAVESGANDPTAISYQTLFISNYKSYVLGKQINDLKVSNVSGSSLTSQGFNNAIKQIENQAKA